MPSDSQPTESTNPPELTERERAILEHTTGWRSRSPLYRNHYSAGESHDNWSTLQGLVARGLMNVLRAPEPTTGGDTVFCATAIGIGALRRRKDAPKSTEAKQGDER